MIILKYWKFILSIEHGIGLLKLKIHKTYKISDA